MSPEGLGLADVLDRQRDDERERALRALMERPLLTDASPELGLVRRHSKYLGEWFQRECGWSPRVDRGLARLFKRPAATSDATRGAPEFDRERYVLLCLVCAVLERAETQTTLKALGERLLDAAADPELADRGFEITLEPVRERRSLVHVCRFLIEHGVLCRVAGDEEAYVNRSGDALYDVNNRALAALPASSRGASYLGSTGNAPTSFEGRLAALIDEYVQDSVEGRRTAARHRLARRFLDDPVTYDDELDDEERQYLTSQRGPMSARLAHAVGLTPEVRSEGVALVDPEAGLTDEVLPAVGTEAHATLLVAEYLTASVTECDDPLHSIDEIAAFLREAATDYGRYWRKSARGAGAEWELAEEAIRRLERLKLVRRTRNAIEARPALLRYRIRAVEVEGSESQ